MHARLGHTATASICEWTPAWFDITYFPPRYIIFCSTVVLSLFRVSITGDVSVSRIVAPSSASPSSPPCVTIRVVCLGIYPSGVVRLLPYVTVPSVNHVPPGPSERSGHLYQLLAHVTDALGVCRMIKSGVNVLSYTTLRATPTMAKGWVVLTLLPLIAGTVSGSGLDQIRILGPQAVNLWKLQTQAARTRTQDSLIVQDAQDAPLSGSEEALLAHEEENELTKKFRAQWFEQPVDHNAKADETEMWRQRYWINTRHYIPGPSSPVFVLDGGETSGVDRLPFLDTGIMAILARATGGIGVVLEHR